MLTSDARDPAGILADSGREMGLGNIVLVLYINFINYERLSGLPKVTRWQVRNNNPEAMGFLFLLLISRP